MICNYCRLDLEPKEFDKVHEFVIVVSDTCKTCCGFLTSHKKMVGLADKGRIPHAQVRLAATGFLNKRNPIVFSVDDSTVEGE